MIQGEVQTAMEAKNSFYRLRKLIGTLGLLLPLMLTTLSNEFLATISHYYYSTTSFIFTSIVTCFGLFLVCYGGYKRDPKKEWLSDNVITTIGGLAAIALVWVPTVCSESLSPAIDEVCKCQTYPMFGHDDDGKNIVHLGSAALFFIMMGWMSIKRFPKGTKKKGKAAKNFFYKLSGWVIIGSIVVLAIEKMIVKDQFGDYDTIILEIVAITFFGLSWLIKGKAVEDTVAFFKAPRKAILEENN